MCIKNFKKTFVAFFVALAMIFALVGCGGTSTSQAATEARKNLKAAVDQIALEHTMDLNNVVDDIKLNGVLVQFGATVTWESSDESHLKIEADGVNYIARVFRPQPSEENAKVTLTATISVEYEETDGTTKSVSDEKSYTLTVVKSEPAETLTEAKAKAAAELAKDGKTSYTTNFYGTVTAVMKDGQQFFVTDGTTGIYVYVVCEGIKVGDVVNVQGTFSTYYGTLQIAKEGGAVKVLEADAEGLYHDEFGNVLYTAEGPLKSLQGAEAYAQDVTVSQLVNQDTADGCFGGQAATLYGKLVLEKYLANTYENYFIIDPYTAERVLVYYKSIDAADKELLASYLGQYVTINVATYDQKNEDGMGIVKRVALVADSVKAAEAPKMNDEEKLANLLASLQLPESVESEYTLSSDATWEVVSGNATIEEGVLKVTQASEEQTVVIRATVTVGALSDTKEFTITVPSSKIEVLTPTQAAEGLKDAANDGVVLYVGGFVAEGSKLDKYGNFVLEDSQGGTVTIYGGFGKDAEGNYLFNSIKEQFGIEVGVYVVVKGKYTPSFNNVTGTEIISASVDATKATAGLADAANDGLEVLVHGTIAEGSKLDKYGNFVLEDANGGTVTIYGGFGKDAEGNYLFNSIKEQLGLAVGVKVVVRGTYSSNFKNVTGLEILMAMAAGETPEPTHEHTPCAECGKCTAEDCTGEAADKCAGHEAVEPEEGVVELTVNSLGIASQTYAAGTPTVNGVAFEFIQLGNYGNGIQMRDKDGNTSHLWNTSAFAGGIVKIELQFDAAKQTYDNADAVIFRFGNSAKAETYVTKLSTVSGTKTYTITPDAETYTFFYLEHDLSYTFYWASIKVYFGEATGETPEPTHTHTPCDTCQLCTAADCTGEASEKCAGHEETPEPTYLTIAEVKAVTSGTVVTLKGVVIAKGTESLLIQDATGAIMLYKTSLSAAEVHAAVEVGQEVAAEGKYSPYNGLHEVANLTNLEVVSTSTASAPTELAAIDAATIESLQCQIVSIELTYVSGTVADKSNATFTDAKGNTVTVRGDAKWGTVAAVELVEGAKVKVTAFVNWYNGAQLTNVSNYTYVELLEQGVVPTHEHTPCDTCQLCTAADCTGEASEKCAGHQGAEVEAATWTYSFAEKQYSANGSKTLNGVSWTLAGDGGYWGYDTQYGKGQQFGSSKLPYKSMTFTSTEFTNVSKLVINTSGASSINGSVKVYVGETLVDTIKLTSSATDYTITLNAPVTGAIKLEYTQTSSKAIYIKTITVEYAK